MKKTTITNKLLTAFIVFLLPANACNSSVNTATNKIERVIINKTNLGSIKKGAEIRIRINSLSYGKMAYSDAVFPKTNADVQAYWLFLTNNYDDPFATNANILPEGQILKFNKTDVPDPVVFEDIQDGGPYYAVVAAFDGTIDNTGANNITEPDDTLLSIDKKWRRSTNFVMVVNSSAEYSGDLDTLNIQLQLKFGVPTQNDTSVSIIPGAPYSGSETIN